VEAVKARRNI